LWKVLVGHISIIEGSRVVEAGMRFTWVVLLLCQQQIRLLPAVAWTYQVVAFSIARDQIVGFVIPVSSGGSMINSGVG
jgi:hypothetical protein